MAKEDPGPSEEGSKAVPPAEVELRQISIEDLRFDETNPRIVELLGDTPRQADIERLLLGDEMRAAELIPSFIENGYIAYEPLIVRRQNSKDLYVVVEGNRRLAAIRSMEDSDDEHEAEAFRSHGLSQVPCLIFTGEDDELLSYLGLRHLSKTKDWSTNAKGAFVERMLRAGHGLSTAARKTNTTTNALRLILLTRRMFDEARDLDFGLSSSTSRGETLFWHLGDALRRTRTKAYIHLEESADPLQPPTYDQTRFENLVGWLYGYPNKGQERVISSIRDIGKLDECLGDARAVEALENGASLSEAAEELTSGGATVANHLDRARRSVGRATSGVSEVDANGLAQVKVAAEHLSDATDIFEAALGRQAEKVQAPEADSE